MQVSSVKSNHSESECLLKIQCSICNFNGHSTDMCSTKTLSQWNNLFQESKRSREDQFYPIQSLVPTHRLESLRKNLVGRLRRRFNNRFSVPGYIWSIHTALLNVKELYPEESHWEDTFVNISDQIDYVTDRSRSEFKLDKSRLDHLNKMKKFAIDEFKRTKTKLNIIVTFIVLKVGLLVLLLLAQGAL